MLIKAHDTSCLNELILVLQKQNEHIPKEQVLSIINEVKNILENEPTIQVYDFKDSADKVVVVGDTHGQFYDLLKIMSLNDLPSNSIPYVFNGDFVDRGAYGIEVVLLICLFKIAYPESVFLNRGNHESGWITNLYGFKAECLKKYDNDVYEAFINLFQYQSRYVNEPNVVQTSFLSFSFERRCKI